MKINSEPFILGVQVPFISFTVLSQAPTMTSSQKLKKYTWTVVKSGFPLFRADKIPWLLQYFFQISSIFLMFYFF